MVTNKEVNDFWDKTFSDPGATPFTQKAVKPYKKLGKDTPKHIPVFVDGDIIAYRASAPCDGRGYQIVDTITKRVLGTARYNKEIQAMMNELMKKSPNPLNIEPTKNPEPESFAIYNVDQIMSTLVDKYPKGWFTVYLTGNENYRSFLDPNYKANRSGMERPVHLNACKQYLINRYNAVIQEPFEADDLMGIKAMSMFPDRQYVIATIDKDLDCIPGKHFNFVKGLEYDVTEDQANLNFYMQCLTGDSTDNIPGIKGVGPKTAEKILKGCKTADEMYTKCVFRWAEYLFQDKKKYTRDELQTAAKIMSNSAELLWILREEGEVWSAPQLITLNEEQTNALEQERPGGEEEQHSGQTDKEAAEVSSV
jgi:DNA polymerase-1